MKTYLTKIIISAFAVLLTISEAFALSYICGEEKNPRKFSEIKTWYNSVYNQDTKMTGKPGRSDMVIFANGDTTLDVDIEFGGVDIGAGAILRMHGRKFKSRHFEMNMPQKASIHDMPLLEFKNSVADLGGFSIECSVRRQEKFGCMDIILDNSQVVIKMLNFGMSSADPTLAPFDSGSGLFITLKGNSSFSVTNGVFVDMLSGDAKLQFNIIEDAGKMPSVLLASPDVSLIVVDVKTGGNLKKGLYPLVQDSGKKVNKGNFRAIKVDNATRSVGDKFSVGEKSATLIIDAAGKDGKKHDLILRVD